MGDDRRILRLIFNRISIPINIVFTNLVACRATIEGKWGLIDREPTDKEIELCQPKLDELVTNLNPCAIIYIGKIATNYKTKLPTHQMLHPTVISRMEYKLYDIKEQALLLDRFIANHHHEERPPSSN